MNDAAQRSAARALVCPFVALAEDRNRRADVPDQRNRCYAEPAPRQRDLGYQADYCYSPDFSSCSVFLAWAARNAAEPSYVAAATEPAPGWDGVAEPADGKLDSADAPGASGGVTPSVEGGLFGPDVDADVAGRGASEQVDWISASAWADAPWDEQAEAEAEQLAAIAARATLSETDDDLGSPAGDVGHEEDTVGPKVPAALPMPRRRTRQRPIRTRGSGEWFYADPLDREPIVRRRHGITPPVLLGVLGLLVVALVLFMIPTLLSDGNDGQTVSAPSSSPRISRPTVTRAPDVVAAPQVTAEPSPTPPPQIRTYRIKAGDTLSLVAVKQQVSLKALQCLNGIRNPNLVQLGQLLEIPPLGYICPPGWRRGATLVPEVAVDPQRTAEPSLDVQSAVPSAPPPAVR